MAIYTGRKVSAGMAKEDPRGTPETPALYFSHTKFDVQEKIEYKEHEGVKGTLAKSHKKEIVRKRSDIALGGVVGSETFGNFLLALLGSVTSTTVESGVYQHIFTLLENNLHPTYTLAKKDGVEAMAYPLCSLEKLTLDIKQDAFVMLDSSWQGKSPEAMTLTPSYFNETDFTGRKLEIYFADNLAGLDAATEICVESGSVEATKEIEQVFCVGDLDPKETTVNNVDLQLALTVRHINNTYSTNFRDGVRKAMRIRMIDENVTIGTTQNPTIEIDVAEVLFENVVTEGGKDDVIRQNLTLSSLFDLNSATLFKAKMINTTNTY